MSELAPPISLSAKPARDQLAAIVAATCGSIAFAVYAATAARTITWWDGSSYPLAAWTLGINSAPGSLLLVLLGWALTRVTIVQPVAFQLNLVAALCAAMLVGTVTRLAIRLSAPEDRAPEPIDVAAGAVAGLTLAFTVTVWGYATQFTPYILTALFTSLILAAALAWWRQAAESDAPRQLFVIFLLFGLDFSVHRTNLLLLPAALLWIVLRRVNAWRSIGVWAAGGGGLALGLAVHLLIIPIARRDPPFNMADPSDLSRWWSYVTLEQQGGGFLIRLWPRAADLVRVQLGDYLGFLRSNLWPVNGPVSGILPVLLAVAGVIAAVRTTPRRGLGLLGFFLCASLGAVLYFNLPANYFRTMGRHYLPSLVVLAPFIGVGAGAVMRAANVTRGSARAALTIGVAALLVLAPVSGWFTNRHICDLSRARFTESISRDLLASLPTRAFLLTNGDNDTFPLWYLQQVERVRTDVTVINLPCANTGWYVAQLRRADPDLASLLEREQARDVLAIVAPPDSIVAVAVEPGAETGLPPGVAAPESVVFRLPGELYGEEQVLLDLLRRNRWRRPVHLAATVTRDHSAWLWPYARLAGLSYRVVPSSDPAVWDLEGLRHTMLEVCRYEGVADTTVAMDATTRGLCGNYTAALFQLASAQLTRNDPAGCLATLEFFEVHVPPRRLALEGDPFAPLREQARSRMTAVP